MAEMKKLTINGNTYTVTDPDAVLYTPQTLTPEQQAQARENIGAASSEDFSEVKNTLNSKITKTLLWRNAAPASEFKPQTLSLSKLGSYNGYEIVFFNTKIGANALTFSTGFIPVLANTVLSWLDIPYIYTRRCAFSSSSLAFTGAGRTSTTSNNQTEVYEYCIPYEIYGIKGVS